MTVFADLEDSASLFAALGEHSRLALVVRLSSGGPSSISQLTSGSAITRQAVSQHLQVLAHAGLVRGTRHGRERIWEVETRRFDEARAYLEQISQGWDSAIERLTKYVEE